RLDLRKRQVMVNVRVLEVSVNNGQTLAGEFTSLGGNPSITQTATATSSNTLGITLSSNNPITLPTSFIAALTASISNGSAKVITDPNLTVQEGETATIALTDQVVNNITSTSVASTTGGPPTTTTTATFAQVGLTLAIQIERIDDNGFINLSVSPRISVPLERGALNSTAGDNFIIPISERVLNSGRIRLRDAQTLVLSGVIRDSDSEAVQKIPLLGDIPIIGALFRTTTTTNRRSEVIIIVTPRIIDDSQDANWGYTYQPGPEAQKVLDSNQRKTQ
ncbi:MAG: type II secretion system protein GspD, partial [Pseudanabaena sp.]